MSTNLGPSQTIDWPVSTKHDAPYVDELLLSLCIFHSVMSVRFIEIVIAMHTHEAGVLSG